MTLETGPVEIEFLSYTRRTQDSALSVLGANEALDRLLEMVDGPDLASKRDRRYERHDVLPEYLTEEGSSRISAREDDLERGMRNNWVPPLGSQEIWDTLQVVAVSAAGAAVFLRNVSGFLKDILDMRRRGFSINVRVNGTHVVIDSAKQLQSIIDRLEKSPSSAANSPPSDIY